MNQHNDIEVVWRPDVTVATIIPRDGRFLVVEERIRGELVVNQPAGHLEPNESLADAARRETLEETGWTVELTDLIGVYQWTRPEDGWQVLRVTFAGLAVGHDPARVLDAGIERALWLSRAEISAARARSPLVLRNIDDWLGGRRFQLEAIQMLAGAGV
jgi:8-oxo-dGTP pyrophosphatase MutT (NUDIX family)